MKRRIGAVCALVCIAACCCPTGAAAFLPAPWIRALKENMGWLCEQQVSEGVPIEAYIWVRPDPAGIFCVEYRVGLNTWIGQPPYGITFITGTPNPAALFVIGTPVDSIGTTICFPECREDYFWAHRLVFMPTSNHSLVYVDIIPHGQSGEVRAVSCAESDDPYIGLHYYIWDATAGIGGTCPGIRETSWGAIKSLYR